MRRLSRGQEIILFVSIVLVIAWLPLILFRPMSESVMMAEGLLSGSEGLFPDVEGYSLLEVDEDFEDEVRGNMMGSQDLINEDTVSAYVYWRGDEQVLLVIKKIEIDSDRDLEEYFARRGWAIDLEKESEIDGIKSRVFRAKKDDDFLSVMYWRVPLFKRESKLLFFSTPRGVETIHICIATPSDFDSEERLGLIAEGAVFPVLKKIYI